MDFSYTWISFYQEVADKLLTYQDNRKALITILEEAYHKAGKKMPNLNKGEPAKDIDPFTFVAQFTHKIDFEGRLEIMAGIKEGLGIDSDLAKDKKGIPTIDNLNKTFYNSKGQAKANQQKEEIDLLWEVFEKAKAYADWNSEENLLAFEEAFEEAGSIGRLRWKLPQGLMWIRPYEFISLERISRNYIKENPNNEFSDYAVGKLNEWEKSRAKMVPLREYLHVCDEVKNHHAFLHAGELYERAFYYDKDGSSKD